MSYYDNPLAERRRAIERERRQLREEEARLERLPDSQKIRRLRNGSVLIFHIRYEDNPTVYTYTAVKAKGRWYMSGTGRVPQDAGWGAVERWLLSEGREIVAVYRVKSVVQIDNPDPDDPDNEPVEVPYPHWMRDRGGVTTHIVPDVGVGTDFDPYGGKP